ncbi:aldo/keto reductase [Mesorhizobium amorphae]|uniref:Aldo/keto reductase n=1 Tax=Mesorhizobium amorphae CCNWGS0123 TaxID=1082933 RepID=G6Y273_9HYPH|nr:aldo/keto reductase [Mesorhizobium amorphae]EHH14158.1 aldo/keto reductase [Mesorhizobium amorphae CCNWGS0123]GLR40098.1 oxidoreductase [Mesorhizobium amorphae]
MAMTIHLGSRIGMGCWAIGGHFWSGETPVGYSGADDSQSVETIHAAWDGGIRLFDTSAVYGAGHSEALLGEALSGRSEAIIVSKFGHSFDPVSRQMTGPKFDPDYVRWSVAESLRRLGRDCIDVMLLHLNDLTIEDAAPAFEVLEQLVQAGDIRSYGWSSDFPPSVEAFADRSGFSTVQHAMNVFFDAPSMCKTAHDNGLAQLIRSPLAMGVLTGKFSDGRAVPSDDVRSVPADWQLYFEASRARPDLSRQIDAIRDLLTVGGRTLGQGALCWLLSKGDNIHPIPGAKTPRQAVENAAATEFGPLPESVMVEIETILQRPPEGEFRAR